MHRLKEDFSTKIETMRKKNQMKELLEMKSTITEMKNSLDKLTIRLKTSKKGMCELEDRRIEIKIQRGKKLRKKNMHELWGQYQTA